jgi:hypothetical protein
MTATCSAYVTEDEAREAVERLLAGGVPGERIRVLMGEAERDARDAAAGSFGGVAPASRPAVGTFAGASQPGSAGMGTFAGDPDAMRRGGFGDLDRETVTTYGDGVARVRGASHRRLRELLLDAGLDEATTDADLAALHRGRILVLVAGER